MEATPVTSKPANPEPNFFLPRGRIGVRSMLVRSFACYLLLVILGFLLRAMSVEFGHGFAAFLAYPLATFMLITSIKRAHDMGYSGWAVIILAGLPFLLFLPGTKCANRFGPLPIKWF